MIGTLQGTIRSVRDAYVIVDVHGVGFKVIVASFSDSLCEGEEVFLFTELITREDSLTLYGFAEEEEKELFTLLCSVSGIGPKGAIAAITSLGAIGFATAVKEGDVERLMQISGVGRKSAQRIILELSEKIQGFATRSAQTTDIDESVRKALVNLGYLQKEVDALLPNLLHDNPDEDVSTLLRLGLQELSRR